MSSTDLLESLNQSGREFTKSFADYSLALAVYGVSQSGKVLRGLPTKDPTLSATASFVETTGDIKGQFDPRDNAVYSTGKFVQDAVIDVAFNLVQPKNYRPETVVQTTRNVTRWGLGLAAQLIPGGQVGNGGPPTGWGPVNREDAELFRF